MTTETIVIDRAEGCKCELVDIAGSTLLCWSGPGQKFLPLCPHGSVVRPATPEDLVRDLRAEKSCRYCGGTGVYGHHAEGTCFHCHGTGTSVPDPKPAEPAPAPDGECPHRRPRGEGRDWFLCGRLPGWCCLIEEKTERRECPIDAIAVERDRWLEVAGERLREWEEASAERDRLRALAAKCAFDAQVLLTIRAELGLTADQKADDAVRALQARATELESALAELRAVADRCREAVGGDDRYPHSRTAELVELNTARLEAALSAETKRAEAAEAQARGCFQVSPAIALWAPHVLRECEIDMGCSGNPHRADLLAQLRESFERGPFSGPGYWVPAEKVREAGAILASDLTFNWRTCSCKSCKMRREAMEVLGIPPEALKPE